MADLDNLMTMALESSHEIKDLNDLIAYRHKILLGKYSNRNNALESSVFQAEPEKKENRLSDEISKLGDLENLLAYRSKILLEKEEFK